MNFSANCPFSPPRWENTNRKGRPDGPDETTSVLNVLKALNAQIIWALVNVVTAFGRQVMRSAEVARSVYDLFLLEGHDAPGCLVSAGFFSVQSHS